MRLSFTDAVWGWQAPALDQPGLLLWMLRDVTWHKRSSRNIRGGGSWDVSPPAMPGKGFEKGLAFLPC